MVVNPDDVILSGSPGGGPPVALGLPPDGPYDHVIITSSTYESYWQPLVDWHTKRGLKDTVVTTDYIYSNYAGTAATTNQERIRNFIIDAHSSWGTQYILMAGEDGTVPFEYRNYYENAPSDQYYSDYDDDWTHEVYVGRATAEGSTEISTFVNKVINYEKNPPLTNYLSDVLLVGMDLDSSTHSELLKEDIDAYIPSSFDVTKVYDSDISNHKTDTINALNDGQHLMNHADHGNFYYMGTGSVNHGLGLNNGDIDALVNNNKPSIVVSLACDSNGMDASDCIAEHFVINNPSQAGIAFNGNTRYGLYYAGDTNRQMLSGKLDFWWWRSLFELDKYILGETIVEAKHHFGTDPWNPDAGRHCVWEFSLLGEPAMPIWTDTPASLDVTHPLSLPVGSSTYAVHVESGGTPLENAYVCLWKDDEVYLRDYTDSSGDISFSSSPSTSGTMYVTVTKHNYLPYEGEATIAGGNQAPYIPNNPSPSDGALGVSINVDLSWDGGDPDSGDDVYYEIYFGTDPSPSFVERVGPYSATQTTITYDPGTLSYNAHYYWKINAEDGNGATAYGSVWDFFTEELNQAPYIPSNPSPREGTTGASINVDLSWDGGDPNSGDSVYYDVYFGTTTTPPYFGTIGPYPATQTTITYDLGALSYNTHYYWKITAEDDNSASAEGPIWDFTTQLPNQPPYTPSNPSPADGLIDVDINADLSWDGGDPNSGDTVYYEVYLGETSPPVYYDTTSTYPATQTHITYNPGALSHNTHYYWQIVAYDDGLSNTGPIWDFTTADQPAIKYYATMDIPIQNGGISGIYSDTQTSNDISEGITERQSGGKPSNRYSYLEHKWTINVADGYDTYIFYIEAHHTANDESDNFIFAYSTDDSTYTDMLTVVKTADDDNYQMYILPSTLSGTIYIRVLDTDQTSGNRGLDTIYIDHMYIEAGGTPPPNRPPSNPADPTPSPGATNVDTSPTLSVYAEDPDNDVMDVAFYEVGNSVPIDTVYGVASGSYASIVWNGLDYETAYSWYAVADDGESNSNYDIWTFTTRSNVPPTDMYVSEISWSERIAGKNIFLSHTVAVMSAEGVVVSGATVYSTLTNTDTGKTSTFSGVTDETGKVSFEQKCKSGYYEAFVTDIVHTTYDYNHALDVDNPDYYTIS